MIRKPLLFTALGLTVMFAFAACSPLRSNALRHEGGGAQPIGPPDSWTSGGHFTGFSPSRPSAHGYDGGSSAAPC